MSKYFKEDEQSSQGYSSSLSKLTTYLNAVNDKIQFYKRERWSFIVFLTLVYMFRLWKTGGYHALTYCIGIHLLNSFIGFISPIDDPEEDGYTTGEGSFLPQKNTEEFRPFQRKVKEYHFWHSFFWPLFIGILLTFSEGFNIPVYWPLLVVYFVLIFFLTMRKQINHMIKYQYLPWDEGKAKYGNVGSK